MSIVYTCKHCDGVIGRLERHTLSISLLGMKLLMAEEKTKMIRYSENGDMQIKVICEECEASLAQYPVYYELEHFIQ